VQPFVGNLLHRNRGLVAFYTAMLFLSLPVPFALTVYNAHRRFAAGHWVGMTWFDHVKNATAGASHLYNAFSAVFFTAVVALIPLVLSISMFSYMHSRRAVDVYHSLPLTRQELFLSNAIAAAVIMWVPLAAVFAVTGAISAIVPGMSAVLLLKDLFFWASAMLAIFAIASFCATQVGTPQDQALFALVVSASAAGVALLLNLIASEHLYGYSIGDEFLNLIYRLCPFSLMIGRFIAVDAPYYSDSNFAAIVWLLVSVALLLVSAWLYARRRSEQAEVLGNMGPLQIYVRLVGTIVGGIGIGFLIWNVLDIPASSKWILPCIVVGALSVYPIGDAILARRVRGPRQTLPMWLATAAIACLACAGVIFDPFGYAARVPDPAQVESVRLDGLVTRYTPQNNYRAIELCEPDSIETVVAAHREQVQARTGDRMRRMNVTYTLKNGKRLSRSYSGLCEETNRLFASLETNDEVLRATAAVFGLAPERVTKITVADAIDGTEAELNLSEIEKRRLLEALQIDLLAQPQSELEQGGTPLAILYLEEVSESRSPGAAYRVAAETYRVAAEENVYYSTYAYLVTESFTRTLRELRASPAVREQAGLAAGDFDEIETVGLWLCTEEMRWYSDSYFSAGSSDFNLDLRYYYDTEESPYLLLTKDEFVAARIRPMAYYPNTAEDLREMVAILYRRGDPNAGGSVGRAFARLGDLPQELQERVLAAYAEFHEYDDGLMREIPLRPATA